MKKIKPDNPYKSNKFLSFFVSGSFLTLGNLFRVSVTLVLMALLFYKYDISQSISLIKSNIFPIFLLGCLLLFCSLLLNAYRWHLLVPLTGSKIKIRDATYLTILGHFFNQMLPTSIGGDIVRGWQAHKIGMPLNSAAISVALDRIIGLSGLLILIIVAQPFLLQRMNNIGFQLMSLGLISIGIVGLFTLFKFHYFSLPFEKFELLRGLYKLSSTTDRLSSKPLTALITLIISLVVHFLALLLTKLYASALEVNVSFFEMSLIVPTVLMVSSLPVSIGGWGVREAGLAAGFIVLGHSPSHAITISLLIGLSNLAVALPGVMIWALKSDNSGKVKNIKDA